MDRGDRLHGVGAANGAGRGLGQANQPLLDLITEFAHPKGASAAQVSLAWMLHKYDFLVPGHGVSDDIRVVSDVPLS